MFDIDRNLHVENVVENVGGPGILLRSCFGYDLQEVPVKESSVGIFVDNFLTKVVAMEMWFFFGVGQIAFETMDLPLGGQSPTIVGVRVIIHDREKVTALKAFRDFNAMASMQSKINKVSVH